MTICLPATAPWKQVLLAIAWGIWIAVPDAFAQVEVDSYYRDDGTFVEGHYRSEPDGIEENNWSYDDNDAYYDRHEARDYPEPDDYDTYPEDYYEEPPYDDGPDDAASGGEGPAASLRTAPAPASYVGSGEAEADSIREPAVESATAGDPPDDAGDPFPVWAAGIGLVLVAMAAAALFAFGLRTSPSTGPPHPSHVGGPDSEPGSPPSGAEVPRGLLAGSLQRRPAGPLGGWGIRSVMLGAVVVPLGLWGLGGRGGRSEPVPSSFASGDYVEELYRVADDNGEHVTAVVAERDGDQTLVYWSGGATTALAHYFSPRTALSEVAVVEAGWAVEVRFLAVDESWETAYLWDPSEGALYFRAVDRSTGEVRRAYDGASLRAKAVLEFML